MNATKQKAVFSQYIDQYLPVLTTTLTALRSNKTQIHIPYAQFLFSVIDYFGLLYTVADKNRFNKYDKSNFLDFFSSSYFPKTVHCKNHLLYFIRNGVMHQMFAKAIALGTSPDNHLFFTDTRNGNIPALNLIYLDQITADAVKSLVDDFKHNSIYIDNLHDKIIVNNYGLNDHTELQQIVTNTLGGNSNNIIPDCP